MKTQKYKIIHAGHFGNPRIRLEDNTQENGLNINSSNLEIGEEHLFLPNTKRPSSPILCEYHPSICPGNIPKYSMKCIFTKNNCSIKKYFDKYRKDEINILGVGS